MLSEAMIIRGQKGRQYKSLGLIAKGGTASVWLVELGHNTGGTNCKSLFAMKWISLPPNEANDSRVARQIINHLRLWHPNVIRFKEVALIDDVGLVIIMEYAKGGALSQKIGDGQVLGEDEARKFFQQLISGVGYCHHMGICHRDLKLNNLVLYGEPPDCLKICDFGVSKSSLLHSRPHSLVGTPQYMAPEVYASKGMEPYKGELADVWSCGAILYEMLVGVYAFSDSADLMITENTVKRIEVLLATIPNNISQQCKDLLRRIFVINPEERITIAGIKKHMVFYELAKRFDRS